MQLHVLDIADKREKSQNSLSFSSDNEHCVYMFRASRNLPNPRIAQRKAGIHTLARNPRIARQNSGNERAVCSNL